MISLRLDVDHKVIMCRSSRECNAYHTQVCMRLGPLSHFAWQAGIGSWLCTGSSLEAETALLVVWIIVR